MAIGRKTGGRVKGTKNRSTRDREDAARKAAEFLCLQIENAFPGDGVDFMVAVYKNPAFPIELRADMAKAAARYERAPLAPVLPPSNPEDEAAKAQRLHALIEDMRKTVGSG